MQSSREWSVLATPAAVRVRLPSSRSSCQAKRSKSEEGVRTCIRESSVITVGECY